MRNGLLGSLAASAGLAQAQAQAPTRLPAVPTAPGVPAAAMAGRSTAGVADAIPIGASTVDQPAALPPNGNFMAAMQQPPGVDLPNGASEEPQLNAERGYGQIDYLLYFIRSQASNYSLVSVGTTAQMGALGVGTTTLFGAQNLRFNPISGGRFAVDEWLPQNRRFGGEFTATVLEKRSDSFLGGFGAQVVARPVIDANTDTPVSLFVAFPGYATGGVGVRATSQYWGFEANGKFKFYCDATRELTLLGGFRYADLNERLDIDQRSIFIPGNTAFFSGLQFGGPGGLPLNEIDVADSFQTRNQYYLAQIGLQAKWRYARWFAQATGKFGIGDVHETLTINGSSTLIQTAGGPANTVPGGLLALSTNIGRFRRDVFTVLPEAQFQLGYRLFRSTDVVAGYQFAYMSRSIRPGTEIDPRVNPVFAPTSQFFGFNGGVARPAVMFRQQEFWVQGFSTGLHIHF